MGGNLKRTVLLLTVIMILASITTMAVSTAETGTRSDDFAISINGTAIQQDPVTGDKTDTLARNSPISYSVKIQNMVLYAETFELKILNIPQNWSALFTENGLSTVTLKDVNSNSDKVVKILVSSSQYSTFDLVVEARSEVGGETKTAEIKLICEPDPITITPDISTVGIGAGMGQKIELNIQNNQNDTLNVSFALTSGLTPADAPLDSGWGFSMEGKWLLIAPLKNGAMNLTIYASKNASPNDEKVFRVECQVNSGPKIYYSKDIKAYVKEVYDLAIDIDPAERSATPGTYVDYIITISNKAKNPDTVRLDIINNPDSWPHVFSGDFDHLMENFKIGAGKTATVKLNVSVIANAVAGKHIMTINLTSKGGITQYQIITTVFEKHDMQFQTTNTVVIDKLPSYPITLAPNKFKVLLKNKGNTLESAQLSIDPVTIPSGWDIGITAIETGSSVTDTTSVDPSGGITVNSLGKRIEFTSEVSELDMDVSRFMDLYLEFSVVPPTSAKTQLYSFQLNLDYGTISAPFTEPPFPVNMYLSTSNIEIINFTLDPSTMDDKVKKFNLTILNNYTLDAEGFEVNLYIGDNDLIDSEEVAVLPKGEERKFVLEWNDPESGFYVINVKIEGGQIYQGDMDTTHLEVTKEEEDEPPLGMIFFIFGLLILLVILATAVLYYKKLNQHVGDEDEDTKEYERVYGKGGKKRSEVDKDTEDYLFGAKTRSRKTEKDKEDDFEKLYGERHGGRKGGRRSVKGKKKQDRLDKEDRKALPPARERKKSKRSDQDRPRKGKRSRDDEDRPNKGRSKGRKKRD